MSPKPQPRPAFRANRAATLTLAALTATLVLSGCFGGVGKAINAVHAAVNSIGNMKNLESQIKKGENAKFEATYQSTGSGSSAPRITLAQEPGGKWLYISPPSDGSGGTEYVSTGKKDYSCSQASAGGKWACIESAETANDDIEAAPFYAYTGGYVYTAIEAASVLAALAGAKVVNSKTSVNGISLKCVSLIATQNGVTSDDKWCVTSDGILGLVKSTSSDNSDNSSFEIKSLDRSPSSSIFTLPQGASVTTGASS